ncbi:MAG: branched-chain amino acid ABC transporter permease [Anaerolineae bacterium]|nr:branched-chain amino acid ABC transporter permease [Anaerolineae bacterium]
MKGGRWLMVGVVLVALAVVPALPFSNNKVLTILVQLFIVAALASSWNILAGFAGQINLGHAAFYGLGALTTRLLWLAGWPLPLSFVAGGAAAALFAAIIGYPALRLRGIYFAIGTLAVAEALDVTVGNILPGNSALPGPQLVSYNLVPRYYLSLSVLVAIVAVAFWLTGTKLGLGMMSVREDEAAAQAIGVDAFRHKMAAFVLSAFLAGITGSTFAYFHVSYYYQFTFTALWTFDAVLVTFVGGLGTVIGPLLGAIFFVVIRDVLATNLTNFHQVIFGVLFVGVVLILPGGLMELWERIQAKLMGSA